MPPTNLPELLQYVAKQEQEKLAAQIAEAQIKLITASYDKAASYTAVIVFGGYAGLFAIWQLTKDHLTKGQVLWSALLALISLSSFVAFEIYKTVKVSRQIIAKLSVLQSSEARSSQHSMLKALREIEEAQRSGSAVFVRIWAVSVALAIACAAGSAGILCYAFVSALAK